ncbi:MAG TPA: preprotein translocase subunit SecE [Solirubrobacteraceae bacterium]|jgi:preprotein translocase subunit SecE
MGPRPAAPSAGDAGIAGRPPIEEGPETVFADDGDDARDGLSADLAGNAAADAAFGAPAHAHERRSRTARVVGFLRGSWAELQRVQWPDRQQVAQATGVVLGFVLLTAVFLGVADYVAGKLINWIV